MEVNIRENSWIAKMAARKLRSEKVAIVIGRTIHLHQVTRQEFLRDERWLRHEMVHVRQYQDYGFLRFIILYLWESIRNGYSNNKYEVEARKAEEISTGVS